MTQQEYVARLNQCNGLNVIFQLTDKCVLKCKYCFATGAHHGDNPQISDELLTKVIRQAFETRHKFVSFEWTGGEAFLLGKSFYEKVKFLQKKFATKPYKNGVQTSGFLFDTELIDWLIVNDFGISLTIDGPKKIHNLNRPSQIGKESFDQVIKTHEYIVRKKGSCGFISTITRNNIGHEAEMLEYFRSLKTNSFHSNPYIYFGKNIVKDESIALNNTDYATYFISQFNAWLESGQLEPIPYTIDYMMSCLLTQKQSHQSLCTYGGRCLSNFIAITPNGDCYNCPKFSGHNNMKLGNIYSSSITQLLDIDRNDKLRDLVNQRISAINSCLESDCKFFYLCNGGCCYHSYIASNGSNIKERDYLCDGKQMVLDYIKSASIALLDNLNSIEKT